MSKINYKRDFYTISINDTSIDEKRSNTEEYLKSRDVSYLKLNGAPTQFHLRILSRQEFNSTENSYYNFLEKCLIKVEHNSNTIPFSGNLGDFFNLHFPTSYSVIKEIGEVAYSRHFLSSRDLESIQALAYIAELYHKKPDDIEDFGINFCGDESDPRSPRYQNQTPIREAMPAIWKCSKCGAKNKYAPEGDEQAFELAKAFSQHIRRVTTGQDNPSDELFDNCIWENTEIQQEISKLNSRQNVPAGILPAVEINKVLEEAMIYYHTFRGNAKVFYEKRAIEKRQAEREARNNKQFNF